MKYWLLDEITQGKYAILEETGYAYEFNADELNLLTKWITVIGCMENPYEVAVLGRAAGMIYNWCSGINTRYLDVPEIKERKSKGYLFLGKMDDFPYYNPSILMRYGVKALVTDSGKLMYFNSNKKKLVNLSSFCRYICNYSFRGNDTCTFYIDGTIEAIESRFYIDIGYRPHFILHPDVNSKVYSFLRSLQSKGVVTLSIKE